jgi:hypothetical protein
MLNKISPSEPAQAVKNGIIEEIDDEVDDVEVDDDDEIDVEIDDDGEVEVDDDGEVKVCVCSSIVAA